MAVRSKPPATFLTVTRVCELLQLSRPVVYDLMRSGRLPYVKLGRQHRIPARALDKLLQDAETESRRR
jgi:excisionase family DNA binding protein